MRVDSHGDERGRCLIADTTQSGCGAATKCIYRGATCSRQVLLASYNVRAGCWVLGAACCVLRAACCVLDRCWDQTSQVLERDGAGDALEKDALVAAHDCHDARCANWRHLTLRTVHLRTCAPPPPPPPPGAAQAQEAHARELHGRVHLTGEAVVKPGGTRVKRSCMRKARGCHASTSTHVCGLGRYVSPCARARACEWAGGPAGGWWPVGE
jgi:hypothetical protein